MLPRHRRQRSSTPSSCLADARDFLEELLDELGFATCSGLFGSFSFALLVSFKHCIPGIADFNGRLSLVFVLELVHVGRDGVDALDVVFGFCAVLDAVGGEDLALSSSVVELSTDCATWSSAVDSGADGAATSGPRVIVVPALDPEVIGDVVFQIPIHFV